MVSTQVDEILKRYNYDSSDIIAILQDVQETYRYLPQEVLTYVADKVEIPWSRMFHLATFFKAFSLEPRGRHVLHVCLGTACHVRGAPRILEAIERRLKIASGTTTPDMSYTLETVNCIGACAMGPVVVVDGKARGKMNPQKAERLLEGLEDTVALEVITPPKTRKKPVVKKTVPKKPVPKKAATPVRKDTPLKKVKAKGSRGPKKPVKKARR